MLLCKVKQDNMYQKVAAQWKLLNESATGDFYEKDRDYNYYTAELYASLFFTKGEICGETNIVSGIAAKCKIKKRN